MSRISKERMEKALEQLKTISKEDYAKVKGLANIVRPLRSVLHKTPDDYGMTGWKDIYFPSDDGIPLEGWYIPAKGGELQGVSQYQELIDLELLKMGAFVAAEMTPHHSAPAVKMPVLMIQVLKDSWTRNPEDAQKTFDLLGSEEKELLWIEAPPGASRTVTITSEGIPRKSLPSSTSI